VKHDQNQFQEFPAPVPAGERLVWRGRPSYKGFAWRVFHIREVTIYFGLLIAWRLWWNIAAGATKSDALISAFWLAVPAIAGIGVLAFLAWLFQRASCYTITNRRVLLQFGVALPMTMNIPLGKIANAALKTYSDGSGNIPLQLNDSKRVSFLLLWPHIRPWRLRMAEPMMRAVPDAANVAARLAEVLSGQPGPSAVAMSQFGKSNRSLSAMPDSPATVAA
jgi:hypothetical protein